MQQQKNQRCQESQSSTSSYSSRKDINVQCPVQSTCQHPSIIYRREPPILLHSIQSSLLTVGQRVRKAIPGGYKIKPRNDLTIAAVLQNPPGISSISTPLEKRERIAISNSCSWPESGQRELMPFCGQLKYGDESNTDIDVPFLCSQDSTVSSSSVNSLMENSNGYNIENNKYFSWSFSAEDILTENDDLAIIFYQTDSKMARKLAQPSNNAYDIDFEDADFLDYGALIRAKGHMIA